VQTQKAASRLLKNEKKPPINATIKRIIRSTID